MKFDTTKYPIFKHQNLSGERKKTFLQGRAVDYAVGVVVVFAAIGLSYVLYGTVNLLFILCVVVPVSVLMSIYRIVRNQTYFQLRGNEKQIKK